jgi:hypothetical protein
LQVIVLPCLQHSKEQLRAMLASITVSARTQDVPRDTHDIVSKAVQALSLVSLEAEVAYKVRLCLLCTCISRCTVTRIYAANVKNTIQNQIDFFRMQGVYCLEEGDRNRHVHVQAAALLLLVSGDNLPKDLQAYLRIRCNFETGSPFRWAVKVVVHFAEPGLQPGLRKVTFEGLVGYCLQPKILLLFLGMFLSQPYIYSCSIHLLAHILFLLLVP